MRLATLLMYDGNPRSAADQVQRWRGSLDPEFQISVNRSPAQFRNDLPTPYRRYAMGPVWRNEKPCSAAAREQAFAAQCSHWTTPASTWPRWPPAWPCA